MEISFDTTHSLAYAPKFTIPSSFFSSLPIYFSVSPHHTIPCLTTGTMVAQVSATDPDGPDEGITFLLTAGARDNFIINTTSGEIQVAKGASLDRDVTPQFEVSVAQKLLGVFGAPLLFLYFLCWFFPLTLLFCFLSLFPSFCYL